MEYDTHTMIDIDIYRFLKTANLGELTGKTYRTYIERFYWYCKDNQIDLDKADAIHVHEWFKTKPNEIYFTPGKLEGYDAEAYAINKTTIDEIINSALALVKGAVSK